MRTLDLLLRLERLAPELRSSRFRIEFAPDDDGVVVRPSGRYLRRVRRLVRLGGLVGVAAGLALGSLAPWGWGLAVLGLIAAGLGPRLVRAAPLLRLETSRLVVLQGAAEAGTALPLGEVRGVEGRYEVFGWEPRSALYVCTGDGAAGPILVLAGTDEPLAVFACRTLGALLDVPARYTGPSGAETLCYRPEAAPPRRAGSAAHG